MGEQDLERSLLLDERGVGENDRYSGVLGYLLSKVETTPTVDEQEMAREIKCLVGVPYDSENPRHVQDLQQFWKFLYVLRDAGPGSRTNPSSVVDTTTTDAASREGANAAAPEPVDDRWKQLGFQSKNPATDFRGGGILSLYCMMYLADKYPVESRRMVEESQRQSSFYLFACACINVTVQLIFYLNLQTPDMTYQGTIVPAPVATKKHVMHIFSESHYQARDAFGELFSKSIMKLHAIWIEMSLRPEGVTLLNFGEALEKNLRALRRACQGASSYDSLEDFAKIMGIDPDKWTTLAAAYYNDLCCNASESVASVLLRLMAATRSIEYSSRPANF
ncbi:unnamed protein product [Amoebophrya sp. A25]|nr:unnamed protein product [Amoebophrya sp. A25]|eukprot:GSA25T00002228001.1